MFSRAWQFIGGVVLGWGLLPEWVRPFHKQQANFHDMGFMNRINNVWRRLWKSRNGIH